MNSYFVSDKYHISNLLTKHLGAWAGFNTEMHPRYWLALTVVLTLELVTYAHVQAMIIAPSLQMITISCFLKKKQNETSLHYVFTLLILFSKW